MYNRIIDIKISVNIFVKTTIYVVGGETVKGGAEPDGGYTKRILRMDYLVRWQKNVVKLRNMTYRKE